MTGFDSAEAFRPGIIIRRVPRPSYKDHPLWQQAIGLVEEAYAVADAARPNAPDAALRLRRIAVGIPAALADALADEPEHDLAEDRSRALGALAEIERQTLALPDEITPRGDALAARARKLYRSVEKALSLEQRFS